MARSKGTNRRVPKRPKPGNQTRPDGGKFDPKESSIKRLTDWDQEELQDEQDVFLDGLDKVSLQHSTRDTPLENDLEIPEQLLDIDDGRSEDKNVFLEDEDSEGEPKPKRQRKVKTQIDNSHRGRFGKLPTAQENDSNNSEGGLKDGDKIPLDEQDKTEAEFNQNDQSDDELTWKSYHVTKSKSKKKKPTNNDQEAIREEEERKALELEEVKRLQAKARSKLVPTDFSSYLDYASDEELAVKTNDNEKEPHQDSRDQLLVKEFLSEPDAIAYLLKTKPECLALVDDLRRSLDMLSELQDKLVSAPKVPTNEEVQLESPVIELLHYQILSTYISNAAFYMHLSLQVPPANPPLLSSVMKSLVELRNTLHLMEQHELIGDDTESEIELGSGIFGQYPQAEFDAELRDLLIDQNITELTQLHSPGKQPRSTKSKVKPSDDDMDSKSKVKPLKKLKDKTKEKPKSQFLAVEDPNISLQNLPPRPTKFTNLEDLSASQDADFIEPSSLTTKEKSEKEKKKKDLRFYTAKIHAKGKRREKALAGSGGISGDSDLPYITKEAQRREFLKQQDHHQTSGEVDDEDYQSDDDSTHPTADSSDYYKVIKELKLSTKKSKKIQYDEQKLAERDALTRQGEIDDEGGPRSINRQILKNKGLTPKRAKENRNPRVKKRKRFEKAQQKVSSQRPTFKPDQAAQNRTIAGYQGERTGVKVGLVKSRKL